MTTVRLGISGLEVSPIAFGTWQLGGDRGDFDERDAVDAIRFRAALFDTAQACGMPQIQRILDRAKAPAFIGPSSEAMP